MTRRRPPIQPGDGVQPLEFEVRLIPVLQKRVDLIVSVDKAIQRRDTDAMQALKAKLAKERHGHLLIRKINEVM